MRRHQILTNLDIERAIRKVWKGEMRLTITQAASSSRGGGTLRTIRVRIPAWTWLGFGVIHAIIEYRIMRELRLIGVRGDDFVVLVG